MSSDLFGGQLFISFWAVRHLIWASRARLYRVESTYTLKSLGSLGVNSNHDNNNNNNNNNNDSSSCIVSVD